MRWTVLPRQDPVAALGEYDPRHFWGKHVPFIAGVLGLLFVPQVRRWTGISPWPVVAIYGVHLANYAAGVHLRPQRRWPVGWNTWVCAFSLVAAAAFPAFTFTAITPLWMLYLAHFPAVAQSHFPSLFVLAGSFVTPFLVAAGWEAAEMVPIETSLPDVCGVAMLSAPAYYLMTILRRAAQMGHARKLDLERRAAVVGERRRLGRELHGSLGAALTEVSLWADVASTTRDGNEAVRAIERAGTRARLALDELRASLSGISSMGGTPVARAAFDGLLRRRLAGLCEARRVRLYLTVTGADAVPSCSAYHLVKIAEEAVLNAVRHASPREVVVRVTLGDRPFVSVRDDGEGFEPGAPAPGNGLSTLRAHASALGGRIEIRSRPGEGAAIELRAGAACDPAPKPSRVAEAGLAP